MQKFSPHPFQKTLPKSFFKKPIAKSKNFGYNNAVTQQGALAQLGAHNTGSVGVRGSNPLRSTMKETSFVYQDKGRFFSHFRQKTGKNRRFRASMQSFGCSGARFFVIRRRKHPKTLVYFLRFFALQRSNKKVECG